VWASGGNMKDKGFYIMNSKKSGKYYIYILQCCNDEFYVGLTSNIIYRTYQHVSGFGSKFTQKNLPCNLVHLQFSKNYKQAAIIEAELARFVKSGWRKFNLPVQFSELFYRVSAMASRPDKNLLLPLEFSQDIKDDCYAMIDMPYTSEFDDINQEEIDNTNKAWDKLYGPIDIGFGISIFKHKSKDIAIFNDCIEPKHIEIIGTRVDENDIVRRITKDSPYGKMIIDAYRDSNMIHSTSKNI
jgi:predicted GIY-YIG superfamily endonuclease